MKLQNPQTQEKMTALLEQFNNQKEMLIMIDRELAALCMQQAKNNATIAAVKSEYEQEAAAIKAKFEQSHALALDDYTLIQKAKAELKARLDFFTATGEELEEKIYQKSEQVFTAKTQLLATRKHLILIIHCLMNLNCQRLIYNKTGNLKPQLKNMLIALNLKQIKGLNVY